MPDETGYRDDTMTMRSNTRELEIVAYLGDFRIVGVGYFGGLVRAGSTRPSDYLRHFNEPRLTLANVSIYSRGTQQLVETAPFVIVNMDKIDFIYARDEVPAPPTAGS